MACGVRDSWSKWQSVNFARYGKSFAKKLKKRQDLSRVLLKHFFEVAEIVLSQGGHIAFEWPKGAKGWLLPELVALMKRHKLFMAECHGWFFGMQSSKGRPMFKPWHIATSSYRLAANVDKATKKEEVAKEGSTEGYSSEATKGLLEEANKMLKALQQGKNEEDEGKEFRLQRLQKQDPQGLQDL